jgi:Nuclease A inhibitor-like protein
MANFDDDTVGDACDPLTGEQGKRRPATATSISSQTHAGGTRLRVPPLFLSSEGIGMKGDAQILAELKEVSAGLFVMSESDYPFEMIQWDGQISLAPEYLRRISGKPDDAPVLDSDLDSFLGAHEQFGNIITVLKDNLTDIKVYQVGTISIPVYIVGRSAEGNWLGLSTRLIQT